jgi:thioredoxin 1
MKGRKPMKELNVDNFENEVLNAEGIVIVDFWGDNCQPCKDFMPIYDELSDELGHDIKFCKANVTQNLKLAISQRIMVLPTIAIYKDGKKMGHAHGKDASKDGILKLIDDQR